MVSMSLYADDKDRGQDDKDRDQDDNRKDEYSHYHSNLPESSTVNAAIAVAFLTGFIILSKKRSK